MKKLTNKQIDAIKIFCITIVGSLGLVYLYSTTLPVQETTPLSILQFIGICFGISLIIHGFHPILLSRNGSVIDANIKK